MWLMKADDAERMTNKARWEKLGDVNEDEKQHVGALIEESARL